MEDDLYYQYYDVLFHDKDYLHETNVVFSLAQQHLSRARYLQPSRRVSCQRCTL